MSDPRRIAELESSLSRDITRLTDIDRRERELFARIPGVGFSAAVEGTKLRDEREMIEDRIIRTRALLVDAKR